MFGKAAGNVLYQLMRESDFGITGQLFGTLRVNQQQRIVVLAKRVRADIADQQRHVFAQALGLGVFMQVVAFCGTAHAKQGTAFGSS